MSDATKLPVEFTKRMQEMLGGEYPEFIRSYEQPRKRGLRVNTLKISPEEFAARAPFHLQPIPWIPEGFYYEQEDAVSRHPFYYAGLYYLQEPSAMTPASVLDVEPGMRVLDLCAAPGGKSTALGAKLKGKGLLVANDSSAARCRALLRNIELAGISNALITNAPGQDLCQYFPEFFDRVLVDAPCSGEGMFRKDDSLIRAWDPQKPERCASIQRELIIRAADMLRPGGKLLYSTCTFSETENEEVITYLLVNRPDMHLLPIPPREGFAKGRDGDGLCVRLWPHKIGGEGHFLALLEKSGGAGERGGDRPDAGPGVWAADGERRAAALADRAASRSDCEEMLTDRAASRGDEYTHGRKNGKKGKDRGRKKENIPRGAFAGDAAQRALLRQFFEEHQLPFPCDEVEIMGGAVYKSAIEPGLVRGIPFVRNGIYLGDLKKDRFEPSQSLALAGAADPAILSLSPDDERLQCYLKGETLEVTGPEAEISGWRLVAADDYPLGWGKCSGGMLKNKLPASWRA